MDTNEFNLFRELINSDMIGWVVLLTFVAFVALLKVISGVLKTRSREQTRREIAAYVAEGSLTPEQGERLLSVGRRGE